MRLIFDRGTIVLRDPPGSLDPATLPGMLWDPRASVWRAPALGYRELHQALTAAGSTFLDEIPASWPPPAEWAPIELRPYQEAALLAWEAAGRRGVVVLPTGAGKTHVALAAMARSRFRSLVLAPTRALVAQWRTVLGRVYRGPIGCYGDGLHDLRAVTVATYESALRHMATIGGRFDLLVVDEAHHVAEGGRDEALEMATARARLGLTATPPGEPERCMRLSRLIGPTVAELAMGELLGGFLAAFDHVKVEVDLTAEEARAHEVDSRVFREATTPFRSALSNGSWSDFVRVVSLTPEGRAALLAWRRDRRRLAFPAAKNRALHGLLARHRGDRVLVFTADNDTAYAIAVEHLIMPLTCDIGRPEREAALERFRRGELRALVSSRVLNEGLDVPDADVAVIVGGSAGGREHVQRIGRLLRPAPGKTAIVYELVSRTGSETRQARRRGAALVARITPPL